MEKSEFTREPYWFLIARLLHLNYIFPSEPFQEQSAGFADSNSAAHKPPDGMESQPAQAQSRIPELDGIRGLAISLVLYDHFVPYSIIQGTNPLGDHLRKTLAFGASGVDLFFVLSGFLIGGILMDNRESGNYFKSFYIRRCCRILPPYLLVLVAYITLKFTLSAYSSQGWFQELFVQGGLPLWANLTFTQNIVQNITHRFNPDWLNVNWSLALEEQFYLVLPLALWLVRPSALVKTAAVLICLNPLLQFVLCIWFPKSFILASCLIPTRADALLVGVICAFLFRHEALKIKLAQARPHLCITLIILLVGMVFIMPKYDEAAYEYERILFFNLWIALFYANLILLALVHHNGILSKMMQLRPLRKLGIISYSVYLFHLPVNGLLHGLLLGRDRRYRDISDIAIAMAALVLTLLLATALWRLLEKPMIAWGHTYAYGNRKTL